MKRAFFTGLVMVLVAGWLHPAAAAEQKPNIILVLVDDMGWGDLGLNQPAEHADTPRIDTPTLDRLATQGAQLRRHYTCAPVCAPARASLFTGLHQGHAEVIRNNSFDAALENGHTLGSVLKAAGYSTALIGKWGIGGGRESGGTPTTSPAWPTLRGFDFFFGYNNHLAGHRHYPLEESNADPETHRNAIWDGDEMITDQLAGCYCTDLFTARAKKWIVDQHEADSTKPFFLALTYVAPHARLGIPAGPYPAGGGLNGGVQWLGTPGKMINTAQPESWDSFIHPQYREAWQAYANERYGNNAPHKLMTARRHASMITRVDEALGDLVKLCEDLGIADNTVIIFTSDNGSHDEPGAVGGFAGHPAPAQDPSFFRSYGNHDGIKRDVFDGGLRVPCVVYGPGIVNSGLISNTPTQFQDWMATVCDLANIPAPMRCDGTSLLPLLQGHDTLSTQPNRVLYAEYAFGGGMAQYRDYTADKRGRTRGEQQVLIFFDHRTRRWLKALRTGISTGQEDWELYDTEADPHESTRLPESASPDMQRFLCNLALWNRRAYDYYRDPQAPRRNNSCGGFRSYDMNLVPAAPNATTDGGHGLYMQQVRATAPWVPAAVDAPATADLQIENPNGITLSAGTITTFTGYINVPTTGHHWHFYLTLSDVPGSRAFVKMHNFNLIDADATYTPGATATESAAANTVELDATRTGFKGIPLTAGLHPVTITVVQGESAPGTLRMEWNRGPQNGRQTPREPIPAEAFRPGPIYVPAVPAAQ
ncbi:MAG: sulfatase-like hydrolase/transferase [Akkermansia sp.]|nr:sulfatase-like hydrolase/transferase [Akkermansia sp.]